MSNKQAIETLAALRFMMSSGMVKRTKENEENLLQICQALDIAISSIDQIMKEKGE